MFLTHIHTQGFIWYFSGKEVDCTPIALFLNTQEPIHLQKYTLCFIYSTCVCFAVSVITAVKTIVPDWWLKHGFIYSSSPLTLLKQCTCVSVCHCICMHICSRVYTSPKGLLQPLPQNASVLACIYHYAQVIVHVFSVCSYKMCLHWQYNFLTTHSHRRHFSYCMLFHIWTYLPYVFLGNVVPKVPICSLL